MRTKMITESQMTTREKTVPRAAMRLNVGEFELRSNGETAKTAPIRMVARTGDPIEHWYWGKIVHDLSGMKLHKPRLTIDYCHDDSEIMGYLNKFDNSSGYLVASGALVPYKDNDRATEVIFKAGQGVPYEASIDFAGPISLEEVPEGYSTKVNGRDFSGPGVIVRQWHLRGVAVCPYGADMNTESALFKEQDEITVKVLSHTGDTMNKSDSPAEVVNVTVEAEPVQQAAEATSPAVEATASAQAAAVESPQHGPFVEAFGDIGARWFLERRKFESCAKEFIDAKNARIAELEGKVARLSAMVGSVRGNEPATFNASDKPTRQSAQEAIRSALRINRK